MQRVRQGYQLVDLCGECEALQGVKTKLNICGSGELTTEMEAGKTGNDRKTGQFYAPLEDRPVAPSCAY